MGYNKSSSPNIIINRINDRVHGKKHENFSMPLISIIIPVYNNKIFIERAISSVLSQEYDNIELLIIDGNSTDGTLETCLKYQQQLDFLISESDYGIYDAMNKGINFASGDWLYFLGSDDFLEPNILLRLVPYLDPNKMLVFGDICFNNGWQYPSFFSLRTLLQNTVHHQGAFYNKKLFKEFRYNAGLKILADYELNLYIYYNKLPAKKVPYIIARCNEGGASSQVLMSITETNLVRSKFLKNKYVNNLFSKILKLYYFYKKFKPLL